MSGSGDISRLADADFDALFDLDGFAFSHRMPPETRAWLRANSDPDRTFVSDDAGALVGAASADDTRMTVPGLDRLPAALVIAVAVVPTHRRQGRMTSLMRAQIDDIRRRGEVIATLYASEGGIYGRFGFGVATFGSRYEMDRQTAHLRPEVMAGITGRTRPVTRDEASVVFADVFERYAPTRAGEVGRKELGFWNALSVPGSDEAAKSFFVVYEEDNAAQGYVSYDVTSSEEGPSGFSRCVNVRELCAVTPRAYAGMWSFVLGVDLVSKVRAGGRPIDEQLRWLLGDTRMLRTLTTEDRTWVRLVDVEAALAGRRYPWPGTLALAVRDAFCPWNDGSYRLSVTEEWGLADLERYDGAADIELDVSALASLYLGGVPASALAMTSLLTEKTEGALALADRMLGNDRPPYCLSQY